MAKNPKKGDGAAHESAKMIGAAEFRKLVGRCEVLKEQASISTTEAAELIKEAVEFKFLDRAAFAIYRRLAAMDNEKLATTLACLDYYIECGGLEKRIQDEPALDIPRQEIGESNVTSILAAG